MNRAGLIQVTSQMRSHVSIGIALVVVIFFSGMSRGRATLSIVVEGVAGSGETNWTFGGTSVGDFWTDTEVFPYDPSTRIVPDQIVLGVPNIWANLGDFATNAQFDEAALSFIGGDAQVTGSISGPVRIGAIYLDSDGTGLGRDDLYWFVSQAHTFAAGESFTNSGMSTLPVDITSFDEIAAFPMTLGVTFNTGLPSAPTNSLEWTFVQVAVPEPNAVALVLLAVWLLILRLRCREIP